MIKLFREVFRSLFKNKITVAGLTILIFLTSAIFTMLNDTSKGIQKQFDKYKAVSKKHDLTVDLNLPTNGNAFNDGYFINGLTRSEGGPSYDKSIRYEEKNSTEQSNAINFELINQKHIKLNNFQNDQIDVNLRNKYLLSHDFKNLINSYNSELSNESQDLLYLDYSENDKKLVFKNDITYPLYSVDSNGSFVPSTKTKTINTNKEFRFDKQYTLSDVLLISSNPEGYLFSQLQSLFINPDTHEMTFDVLKKDQWDETVQVIRLDKDKTLQLLGLKKSKNSDYVYMIDDSISPQLYNKPANENDYDSTNLKQNINYADLFGIDSVNYFIKEKITFKKGQEYVIPLEWAVKLTKKTFYNRKLYETTFVEGSADKWSGAYKSYVESLIIENGGQLPLDFSKFSYWNKEILVYTSNYYNDNGQVKLSDKMTLLSEQYPNISYDEINTKNITLSEPSLQPQNFKFSLFNKDFSNYGSLREYKTILQIEKIPTLNNDIYTKLTDKDVAKNAIQKIKDGALEIVKKEIYNFAEKKVTSQNIGIRESITIDSFNDNEGKKVYHFVNLGDSNRTIDGIQNNNDLLVNEQSKPTPINNISEDIAKYFRSKEIPPYVASVIIKQSFDNILPHNEYISPDFSFDNVVFVNKLNNEVNVVKQKVYKLAFYRNDANLGFDQYNVFAEIGISLSKDKNNNYIINLLSPEYNKSGQIVGWINSKYSDEYANDGLILYQDFLNFLRKHSLTLKVEINKPVWAEISPNYKNNVYVPFGFRGPETESFNQALTQNTLKLAVEKIEKNFLKTDIVRNGFIQKETIYAFTEAIQTAFDKNDFAKIFSSGEINLIVLPKMILDGIYVMSHNEKGDYFKKFLIDIFQKAKEYINKQPEEIRKEYVAAELSKLFNLFSLFSQFNINDVINTSLIAKISKDPILFIDNIINLIKSIDFIKFTDQMEDFFQNKYNKGETDNNGIVRQRKLSVFEIVISLLKSIDQKLLKTSLINILDNIDTSLLKNEESLKNISKSLFGNIPSKIIDLVQLIDVNNNNDGKKFENTINGLKFFIKLFDLNVFIETMESKIKVLPFDIQATEYNKLFDDYVEVTRYYLAGSLNTSDIIYSIIKSLFHLPGSNKRIKTEIANMLNLSFKGSSVEIGENEYLIIPSNDSEKLDYFDLLGLLSENDKNIDTKNNPSEVARLESGDYFSQIHNLINKIQKNEVFEWEKLTSNDKNVANFIFDWNKDTDITSPEFKNKIKVWTDVVNSFELNKQHLLNGKFNESLSSLYNFYAFYQNIDKNLIHSLISKTLGKFITLKEGSFNYLKDFYPIFKIWFDLFGIENSKITIERKMEFADKLLSLANNDKILEYINSFKLFEPYANIALAEETKFGITKGLSNSFKINDELFVKENNRYKNELFANLIIEFPEFETFFKENEFALSQQFSYIGASKLYSKLNSDIDQIDGETLRYNDLHSIVVDNLIHKIFSNKYIYENIDKINKLLNSEYKFNSIEKLGISDVLINPLLTLKYPQVVLWLLTDVSRDNKGAINNSNIGYFLINKTIDLEELLSKGEESTYKFINSFFSENVIIPTIESDLTYSIALDNDLFVDLINKTNKNPELYNIFELHLVDDIFKLVNSITSLTKINNILVFDQPSSYLAKVNYAFLSRNNKEIYNGFIPKDPIELLELVNSLPDKYLLNINGSKYIIVGDDITFDYLYPIQDENNIQLNVEDQAIVYVNDKGFDRIRKANAGNLVKEYLTVKNDTNLSGLTNEELKNELEIFVQSKIDNTVNLQRVFLYNELDPINPERSIRITAIEVIINSVSKVSTILLIILITLVVVSIVFIIKRYISNKNKVIGILVAQGYTPLEISASMVVFAFFTIFTGNLLGYITGFLMQSVSLKILKNYWTIPIETLDFSPLSLIVNIVVPLLSMSLLIITISLRSLRYKSIDLMSGIVELNTGEFYKKYISLFKGRSVKTKFGASLVLNSFWKLTSFGISVVLASITTTFGFATFGVFEKSIQDTYKNRSYNYKFDLVSPTDQGGPINTIDPQNIGNNIYVPVGDVKEISSYNADYFKSGVSEEININKDGINKNGIPNPFDGHLITQFSVNITVDSAVSINPFEVVYNSLPDSQKSRVIKSHDNVGYALMLTQKDIVFKEQQNANDTPKVDVEKTRKKGIKNFFLYVPDNNDVIKGKFYYMKWNDVEKAYTHENITTSKYRDEYREFLVNAYNEIYKINKDFDFMVSFNGIYFDKRFDEIYTYVDSVINDEKIKLYGYNEDSKQIKIIDQNDSNLLVDINKIFENQGKDVSKPIPLIINYVSKEKYKLDIGDIVNLKVLNTTNRYTSKFNELLNKPVEEQLNNYKFKVYAINPTYINNEFIIPKYAADKITGITDLVDSKFEKIKNTKYASLISNLNPEDYKFNGILSRHKLPIQLLWSTGLYSLSGYSPSANSFSTKSLTQQDLNDLFDGIFGSKEVLPNNLVDSAMVSLGYDIYDIVKFLDPNFNKKTDNFASVYNRVKTTAAADSIEKFANIFEDKLYVPSAYTIDSKDIEVSFTLNIAKTVQTIVTIVSSLSFIISIIILIIISTILINENEKNIAIWSILGYNSKEKIKMFFGIYVPFIIISILISLPIAFGMMVVFTSFLTTAASISIPLILSPLNILLTSTVVLSIFVLTAVLSWFNINRIKAIDLLKGK
ncbi:ABC transporter permease [Mycoplasma sp. CSL10166]|uniref:ABC transporter permease n=1 Tax=Mycoplasma sp. CSL10166 TaxID=2813825 RepID=UPI00197CA422|nr:ABC transporter permease [Mycoplasma sp. CSL10166]MBN4084070.1 ABC transporter permease [Mycoplasma sp. CSL10166]